MALMESSQSDLFTPPPAPASPTAAPAAAAGPATEEHQQHPDHEDGRVLDVGLRREGVEHGAEIRSAAGEGEGIEYTAAAGGEEQADQDSAPLLDGEDLMNIGGGDDDEDTASQGVERSDLMVEEEEEEDGIDLGFDELESILRGGTDNVYVAPESESGPLPMQDEEEEREDEEPWKAQGVSASNYALGNEEESIFDAKESLFDAAIREIINKSGVRLAEEEEEEEAEEGIDDIQQLDTAPQASDSLLHTNDVKGLSGREPVVGLPQDAGTCNFDVRGEEAGASGPAISVPEETQFVQTGEEGIYSSHVVSGTTISENAIYASPQVNDFIHATEDGSDSTQITTWPIKCEQEICARPQQGADFVLALEEPNVQATAVPPKIAENALLSLEQEGNSQYGHHSSSEKSKDNAIPLNGRKRKRDETIEGADRVETVSKQEEESNGGVNDQDERGTSALTPASKDEFVPTGLQVSPSNVGPPSSSSRYRETSMTEVPRGQPERTGKQHVGNGVRVSFDARTNSIAKVPEKFSRDEKSGGEAHKEGGKLPLWVKWRGKWEAAIRCCIADCPTTTLKAKPNYSKKKHVVVYFPSARLFSWVDTQHTCPIYENPVPLLTGTHSSGREAVKDEYLPRRRMLLKLGGEMLDISDRLHIKAVVESSQNVNVWKTFAKEAAAATTYAELGILLVRLHLTIAGIYIKPGWMDRRHGYWKEDCAKAASASSLQKLTKELINAVLWEEVAPLWNSPEQPELDPEWEHWKGEAFEEKDSEEDRDKKTGISTPSQNGIPPGRQISAGNGPKRFKEQARARRQTQLPPDALEFSQQKRSKINSTSSESAGVQVSSGFGHATTAFRSPLVHLSPAWQDQQTLPRVQQDKRADAPVGPVACNSGLCSAFLKKKNRRCNRQAKEDLTYCGKHKHLANPENAGNELASEGGIAWESGLCSASMGQESARCSNATTKGSIFCQIHIHLATGQCVDKNGEVAFLALSKEARCHGITTRGVQCTHKPKEGSPFCVKHFTQGTDAQDNEEHSNAIEGPKRRHADDSKVRDSVSSAKRLFERFLKSAEGISPGAQSFSSKKQLLNWTRAEAAQDSSIAEELLKLVTAEMSRLKPILQPTEVADKKKTVTKSDLPILGNGTVHVLHVPEASQAHVPETSKANEDQTAMTCGLCDAFVVRENIGRHWKDYHKKEASVFVKGYACQACSRLYSRKHTVRRHWRRRHQSLPVRSPDWSAVCSTCECRFEDHGDLLEHVCSEHPDKLTSPALKNTALLNRVGIPVVLEATETLECGDCHEQFGTHWDLFHHRERTHNCAKTEVNGGRIFSTGQTKHEDVNDLDSQSVTQLFGCRTCGKKFSLLSDLGRHKEGEHLISHRPGTPQVGPTGKCAVNSESCRLKLPVRRKSEKVAGSEQTLGGSRRSKKKGRFLKQSQKKSFEKDLEIEKEVLLLRMKAAVQTAQLRNLRQLKRGEAPVARPRKALYSLTKGGQMLPFDGASTCEKLPDDSELLDMARSACCQSQLLATLHQKYIKLPDQLFVRVSQICNEANVKVEWLAEGYLCGSGCKELSMAKAAAHRLVGCDPLVAVKADATKLSEKDMDDLGNYHSNSEHLGSHSNAVILCSDLSDGQEPVPVVCFVDQDVVDSWMRMHNNDGSSSSDTFRPWETFNYITKRVLDPSLGLDPENYKVGCSCKEGQCLPESCDHVDIFDNDNLDALDIHGKPMKGRFPYDEKGCILLEEGYLVYECNSSCHCQETCPNRVLQKGVTVKLEVFRTLQKGWAVRAAQVIPRGTFVCEYLGEVLHDQEANKRGERYDQVGCSYLYDIDAHLDTTGKLGRSKPFVIDATKHGNVARFINHSCAPNLVNYQVLVDSMDCQLAHIGLFASRDIESGEELAYDYRYRLLPGKGCPCHCGAQNCRGRLY